MLSGGFMLIECVLTTRERRSIPLKNTVSYDLNHIVKLKLSVWFVFRFSRTGVQVDTDFG